MLLEQPVVMKIANIIEEAKDIKTFIFNYSLKSKPGQFVNVWIPGIDEKPFSVSYQDKKRFGITCFSVGKFSEKLNRLSVGEKVGIRGPYGKGFTLKRGHVVLVGGGCGSAPMASLADTLKKRGAQVEFITGAKSKEYLLYVKRMKKAKINIHVATDNGSAGHKGFVTDILDSLIKKNKDITMVYTCGPEIMMKKVVDICNNHKKQCEISMERYMKCGFGLCGQCCVDNNGARVCKEGPVFPKSVAIKILEFNKYKRDGTGKKIPFSACK